MSMSEYHKTVLKNNHDKLVKYLKVDEEFLSVFALERVLTPEMKEEIMVSGDKQQKASKFLDLLPRRGGTAFGDFIAALVETSQDDLAKMLDPENPRLAVGWEGH